MNRNELYKTLDAVESLAKGEEVFQQHSEGTFTFKFETSEHEYPYFCREGRQWSNRVEEKILCPSSVEVTNEMWLETIRQGYKQNWCSYKSIPLEQLDPDFVYDKKHDYSKDTIDCALSNLTCFEELNALIALADYPAELSQKIWDCREEDNWVLKKFEKFKKYNNRVFIKLTDADKKVLMRDSEYDGKCPEYIVISKNPLDYFYCSYGNKFQSCFALNSSMSCWHGYVPFCITPESYIVYLSDGTVRDVSLVAGHKFHCPQMYWRSWGYANMDGDLVLDKFYRSSSENCLIKFVCDFLTERFGAKCLKYADDHSQILWNDGRDILDIWKKYHLRFYSDSLIKENNERVYFCYARGGSDTDWNYSVRWRPQGTNRLFTDYCKTVTKLNEIDFSKPIDVIDGVLCNPRVCPVTNMLLPDNVEKSPYAKYFSKPVKNLAIVNWIEGNIYWSYKPNFECRSDKLKFVDVPDNVSFGNLVELKICGGFVSSRAGYGMSLKQFKDLLKAEVKNLPLDAILLRVVEDDKVTCQVFRSK